MLLVKFVWEDYDRCGEVINFVVFGGCIILGFIFCLFICFFNVCVYFYGFIEDVVIFFDVEIKCYCKLKKVIIDWGCVIFEGIIIGYDYE